MTKDKLAARIETARIDAGVQADEIKRLKRDLAIARQYLARAELAHEEWKQAVNKGLVELADKLQ